MRALTYLGPRQMELQQMDRPTCEPGEVLIKVRAVGICGSDLGGYLGHHARRQAGLVLGHEVSGEIVETGAAVSGVTVGERVCVNPLYSCGSCAACREGRPNLCDRWRLMGMDRVQGAMADYVCAPARAVRPVASSASDTGAACIEPLACAVHLLSLASAAPFSSLLIVGAGTQGALVALLARKLGYGPILIVDVNPARLEAVTQLAGVDRAIHARETDVDAAVREAVGARGVDVAVEAVGSTEARATAVRCCRAGGAILLLGLAEQSSNLDFVTSIRKEHRLLGSFAYTDRDFATAQRLIEAGDVDLSPWTEVLSLDQGPDAFRMLTTDPGATLKIVLRP